MGHKVPFYICGDSVQVFLIWRKNNFGVAGNEVNKEGRELRHRTAIECSMAPINKIIMHSTQVESTCQLNVH